VLTGFLSIHPIIDTSEEEMLNDIVLAHVNRFIEIFNGASETMEVALHESTNVKEIG
jgi:predicted nucleic acid-binding OB-fold protein